MVLAGEVFIYKLLFQKACNDYSEQSIDELRRKLRGDDEVDFLEDLMTYLDEQLPRAEERETEEVLERAAPVLAALLVPMKKKYDKFVEIKDEVTERVMDVVPVEELMMDYQDTLEDLTVFCNHLKQEVGDSLEDNMDELHRKLWELESNMSESETSVDSPFSYNPIPTIVSTPTRRTYHRSLSLNSNPFLLESTAPRKTDGHDAKSPIEINLEPESSDVTPSAYDNDRNFSFCTEDGNTDSPMSRALADLRLTASGRSEPSFGGRLGLGMLKQRHDSLFVSFETSSPDFTVAPTISSFEDERKFGSVESDPDLYPNDTLSIQPNITVIGVTPQTSRAASPADSPAESPVSHLDRAISIISTSDNGCQSPRSGFYSAVHSRRQSLSNDIIQRYICNKDSNQQGGLETKRRSIQPPPNMDYLSSSCFHSNFASRRSSYYEDLPPSSLGLGLRGVGAQLDTPSPTTTVRADRRSSEYLYHDFILQSISRRSSLGAKSAISCNSDNNDSEGSIKPTKYNSRRSMLMYLVDYVRYQINREVSTEVPEVLVQAHP